MAAPPSLGAPSSCSPSNGPLFSQVASQTGLGSGATCWSQEGPGAQRSWEGPLRTQVCSKEWYLAFASH